MSAKTEGFERVIKVTDRINDKIGKLLVEEVTAAQAAGELHNENSEVNRLFLMIGAEFCARCIVAASCGDIDYAEAAMPKVFEHAKGIALAVLTMMNQDGETVQ
jgi:hypothetical protein